MRDGPLCIRKIGMPRSSTFHCHLGVVARTRRQWAGQRLAYQMAARHEDPVWGWCDFTDKRREHRGSAILLPPHAPPSFRSASVFRDALTRRERRIDAQEGLTIDLGLPRQLLGSHWLLVSAFALKPLVDLGMAGQIDIHAPRALDGKLNPHCHALFSQRDVTSSGFGKKNREWSHVLRERGGQYIRALLAARLTLACQLLSLDVRLDPRRNEAHGGLEPEMRVPRSNWVALRKRGPTEALAALAAMRKTRNTSNAELAQIQRERQQLIDDAPVEFISSGKARVVAPAFTQPPKVDVARNIASLAARLKEGGNQTSEIFAVYQSEDTLELWEGPNAIIFDGWSLRVRGMLTMRIAAAISEIAKLLRWPALVLDGDSPFKEYMTLVTARSGGELAVVSDPPGPKARQVLEMLGVEHMRQVVSRIDGCGMIADMREVRHNVLQFQHAPRPEDGYRTRSNNAPSTFTRDQLAPKEERVGDPPGAGLGPPAPNGSDP
jgi:hypothetical protein